MVKRFIWLCAKQWHAAAGRMDILSIKRDGEEPIDPVRAGVRGSVHINRNIAASIMGSMWWLPTR